MLWITYKTTKCEQMLDALWNIKMFLSEHVLHNWSWLVFIFIFCIFRTEMILEGILCD